ncbi:hypothetical protein ANO11243_087380 [Dothideomycetidae sp. 11243]|nr:hypothetical protein ANO11243_087380 [fungal sp. No.11243]
MSAAALVATMTPPHTIAFDSRPPEPPPIDLPARASATPTFASEKAPPDSLRSSPPKSHSRDEVRGAYRAQSIRAIQEANGDVEAFLEEVETKRRQLDDQIHRYVKQKEREFKLFERDARIKYRSAAASSRPCASSAVSDLVAKPGSPRSGSVSSMSSVMSAAQSPQLSAKAPQISNHSDNGAPAPPRTARDREADLLGVFTPSYLPLLNNGKREPLVSASAIAPSSSAPSAAAPIENLALPEPASLHRANSDPVDDKDGQHRARIKLESRTSSSGSESRSLVSALKSTATQPRGPKRKRVSLVVGDEVVAPSDNVSAFASANELARDLGHPYSSGENGSRKANSDLDRDSVHYQEYDAEGQPVDPDEQAAQARRDQAGDEAHIDGLGGRSKTGTVSALAHSIGTPIRVSPELSTTELGAINDIDAPAKETGQDMFGFDDLGDKDDQVSGEHIENVLDTDEGNDISPVPSPAPGEDIPRGIAVPKPSTLPERPNTQIRTLSSSSSQPVSPGFSKPSVTRDPMIAFPLDDVTPEIEHNVDFGSLTGSHSFLDRTGSLGESFMERNAQELRRMGRRRSSNGSN